MERATVNILKPSCKPEITSSRINACTPRTPMPPGTRSKIPHTMVERLFLCVILDHSPPTVPTAKAQMNERVSEVMYGLVSRNIDIMKPAEALPYTPTVLADSLRLFSIISAVVSPKNPIGANQVGTTNSQGVLSPSASHSTAREPIARPKPSCRATMVAENSLEDPETTDLLASSVTAVVMPRPGRYHRMADRIIAKKHVSFVLM
mmetsp:Transcript_64107/g.157716  ORF Transcript_64107/g.157716 Transcript_64107/m.157716 type:complete len:206 (-) Transcript_64107:101-718(-)